MVYFLCYINIAVSVNSYYNNIATTTHHLSLSSSSSAILSNFSKIHFNPLAPELIAADWNINGGCIIKVMTGHRLYLLVGVFEYHTTYVMDIPDVRYQRVKIILPSVPRSSKCPIVYRHPHQNSVYSSVTPFV